MAIDASLNEILNEISGKAGKILDKYGKKEERSHLYPSSPFTDCYEVKCKYRKFKNRDLVIQGFNEICDDDSGHSTLQILYKERIGFLPFLYKKRVVLSVIEDNISKKKDVMIFDKGQYWQSALDNIIKE